MAGKLKALVLSWVVFWIAVTFLIFQAGVLLWPTSYWITVDRLFAFDTPKSERVVLEVDREIHRRFIGEWSVVVRVHVEDGWKVWCTASGKGDYVPDASLPDPLTLHWWTGGQCETPPPGRYYIATVWAIFGRGPLPTKYVDVNSNVFTVSELPVEDFPAVKQPPPPFPETDKGARSPR